MDTLADSIEPPEFQQTMERGYLAIKAEEERFAGIVPGPCPEWCELSEGGHLYESNEPLVRSGCREHVLSFGADVRIVQWEDIAFDGTLTRQPATVWIKHDDDRYMSLDEALDLADRVRVAADRLAVLQGDAR